MTKKRYSLEELAKLTASTIEGDPDVMVNGIADLMSATSNDISFYNPSPYDKNQHKNALKDSQALALIVSPTTPREKKKNYLINENPSLAFQKVIEAFYPSSPFPTGFSQIHPSAVIHKKTTIDPTVSIGPNAVIDENSSIGENSIIGANVYIGPNVTIGKNCLIHPNVTIRQDTEIGNHVIIQPGAVIAGCGFGYTPDSKGNHIKLNHVGKVIIHDHVEIGANTTIDRGRFNATSIGRGTKIDNLVQIAHNVQIGMHCLIIGQAGIAGSAKIGNRVVLAGQVAVNGHIKVVDNVIAAARTGITKSILKPGTYSGAPAVPVKEHFKQIIHLRNLDKYISQIKQFQNPL